MAEKIDFNATIGPEEVGVIVGAWMFGMFTIQAYDYFSYFPKDSKGLKITVAVLWVLELIHVILSCVGLYDTTVAHFGDGENVLFINKAIGLSLIVSAIVGPGVQVFFADRVRILSGRLVIPVACWFLSFVRAMSLVAVCAATLKTPFIPAFKARWDWLVLSSIAVSTTVDLVVAVSLCVLLWQRRVHSTIHSTRQTIDSLLAWTINTGLLTSVASIMMLIFFITMANFAWLTMLLVIPRLFANSMLASLNSRNKLRRDAPVLFADGAQSSFNAGVSGNRKYPSAIAIEMSRTREVTQDPPSDTDAKLDLKDGARAQAINV
ncbi:hypothetical protein B0H15DRAFT_952116 [Mycena belliarum]|uniref:DUF6534 domain-containing protein n=1 Tax=Mycena belliarum TaxID=1033014 RepID=A0AAD6U0T8_9AGAR|nr:hypothetical protein B0H15DRAFT_952116 [Mycena belliae]